MPLNVTHGFWVLCALGGPFFDARWTFSISSSVNVPACPDLARVWPAQGLVVQAS